MAVKKPEPNFKSQCGFESRSPKQKKSEKGVSKERLISIPLVATKNGLISMYRYDLEWLDTKASLRASDQEMK